MLDPGMLKEAFYHRAVALLGQVGARYGGALAKGVKPEEAWRSVQVDQHSAALAHSLSTLVANFLDAAASPPFPGVLPERDGGVLQKLATLFALDQMQGVSADLLESGFMHPTRHPPLLRAAIRTLLHELRGDAVALVDAFDFSDNQLKSTLGRYDGEAYRALFASAQREPLNAEEPVFCLDALRRATRPKL
ncbi:acyl-CoA dehydrogenase/oxidase C-terminal [Baffinella frigidus]|nr:acyl-CoA dehydrogenase/oxidase C-terminal [Cryptophyta sp. CCMP2293]